MSVGNLLAWFLVHSLAAGIAVAQEGEGAGLDGATDSPAPEREIPVPADYTTPQGFVAPNTNSLDLYVFRQDDDDGRGGNPLKAEGFDYTAIRLELTRPVNEERTLRGNVVLAFIQNDEVAPVPPTVINATTTSASGDILTLDALVALEIAPTGSDWSYTPAVFYHQQIDYIGAGFDLGASKTTNNGDTVLGISYSLRWDFLELNWWDGTNRGQDDRIANNFLFSWEQNFTPEFRMNLALQYTRQDGFLSDQYNFVALVTPQGVPFFYADERLPDNRNRGQVNARFRWSPELGRSVGLDVSYYADDWDVEVWSVEPSFQTTIGKWAWHIWYRYADQSETKYFRRQPTIQSEFQTQDSDLGSFTLHAPGMTFVRPLGMWGRKQSALRFSVWGFDRDDGIDAIGAKIGVVLTW